MDGLGYACAVLLAAVFVRAAAAKLARPAQTAASFVALGVPASAPAARAVPLVELVAAGALLAAPRAGAVGALLMLLVFTALIARAVRSGLRTPCNCFGAAGTGPVSWLDVVRNALLTGLAVLALATPRPVVPRLPAALAAAAVFACGYASLASLRRRRSTG